MALEFGTAQSISSQVAANGTQLHYVVGAPSSGISRGKPKATSALAVSRPLRNAPAAFRKVRNYLETKHGAKPEGRTLFARVDSNGQREYMRRCVLAGVLTDAELTLVNDHCIDAREARLNEERFAKAKKVETWDGGAFLGDTYFASMDELCDHLEGNGEEWPAYVWAARSQTVITHLDVADVVECQITDRGWEDMDTHDLHGVVELQAALAKFVEANASVKSYWPDHSTAYLLG